MHDTHMQILYGYHPDFPVTNLKKMGEMAYQGMSRSTG